MMRYTFDASWVRFKVSNKGKQVLPKWVYETTKGVPRDISQVNMKTFMNLCYDAQVKGIDPDHLFEGGQITMVKNVVIG